MITTILLGIVSSTVAEAVTALNKKLQGTVLQGYAAFLIALFFSVVGGAVKVFYIDAMPLPSLHDFAAWNTLYAAFAQVWVVAQIYFYLIVKNLGMDIGPGSQTTASSGV